MTFSQWLMVWLDLNLLAWAFFLVCAETHDE